MIPDKLYVVGGWSDKKYLGSVEVFDGRKWQSAPPMKSPRCRAGLAVMNDGTCIENCNLG
jgi:hypothetical protein